MTYDRDEILNLFENTIFKDSEGFFTEGETFNVLDSNPILWKDFIEYSGATRFVLVPKDNTKNFAIKIPYNNCAFSPCSYCFWDYCGAELERYNIAEEEGLEKYFAKIEFVGYSAKEKYPIYVQEKCVMGIDTNSKHSLEEIKKTHSLSPYRGIQSEWLTDFRLAYGEEEFFKFIYFIQNKEWDDDLYYNVGYLHGLPIVVDYASYNE